jgi:hypothetical protein
MDQDKPLAPKRPPPAGFDAGHGQTVDTKKFPSKWPKGLDWHYPMGLLQTSPQAEEQKHDRSK